MNANQILGTLLQQGLKGSAGPSRMRAGMQNAGMGGAGQLDQILGGLLGASGRPGQTPAGLDSLIGMLGGMSGGQGASTGGGLGGLAGMLGTLLGGGGQRGGAGGSNMMSAVLGNLMSSQAMRSGGLAALGTLAASALQGAGQNIEQVPAHHRGTPLDPQFASVPNIDRAQLEQAAQEQPTADEERAAMVMVKAMINAAKADGQIDQTEVQKIIGKLGDEAQDQDMRQFIQDELSKPIDIEGVAREVDTPLAATEVYTASLLAIDVDTPQEQQYMRDLAAALRLPDQVVQHVHQQLGVRL
ncbi:MAG: tellurite resistance TerB family protein [Geminicoccaceae bacterium]